MAGSPRFKVYSASGEYVASCKYPDIAAAVVSLLGAGSQIRVFHRTVVWTEGSEEIPAGESYDFVAHTVYRREQELQEKSFAAQYEEGVIAVVVVGKAMPAELQPHGDIALRKDGPLISVADLPETTRVVRNVDFHDPTGRGHEFNLLARDSESGKEWFVYCRAGHLNIPEGGLPIKVG